MYLPRLTYRVTHAQTFLSLKTEADWRPAMIAFSDEKFFSALHSCETEVIISSSLRDNQGSVIQY